MYISPNCPTAHADSRWNEMEKILLEETGSTNSWCADHIGDLGHLTMVRASAQNSGRGQRGNSWESEPGRNLTLSVVLRPTGFRASNQFAISEAVALAVADTLGWYGIPAKVKWPNDIYVGDKKICGILIEHAVGGTDILHSICGAGINVNQREFRSDAPNPVSMIQISGEEYDLEEVSEVFGRALEQTVGLIASPGGRDMLHADFMRRLWRGDGRPHPFRDTATGEKFRAIIADVEPSGYLRLLDERMTPRRYAFKEVEFLPEGDGFKDITGE